MQPEDTQRELDGHHRVTNAIPATMTAVLLTRHGGVDALEYHDDVPTPTPGAGEVLIQVAAAGINNTDINTRVGWYSMNAAAAGGTRGATEVGEVRAEDASWSGMPMAFPRIQGADCCGRIVAVGGGSRAPGSASASLFGHCCDRTSSTGRSKADALSAAS